MKGKDAQSLVYGLVVSPTKKPLGERRNKGHFYQQPEKLLDGGYYRLRIARGERASKEAPAMKRGHTNDNGFIPGESMWSRQVVRSN